MAEAGTCGSSLGRRGRQRRNSSRLKPPRADSVRGGAPADRLSSRRGAGRPTLSAEGRRQADSVRGGALAGRRGGVQSEPSHWLGAGEGVAPTDIAPQCAGSRHRSARVRRTRTQRRRRPTPISPDSPRRQGEWRWLCTENRRPPPHARGPRTGASACAAFIDPAAAARPTAASGASRPGRYVTQPRASRAGHRSPRPPGSPAARAARWRHGHCRRQISGARPPAGSDAFQRRGPEWAYSAVQAMQDLRLIQDTCRFVIAQQLELERPVKSPDSRHA